ncbi:MAG: prolipoprotein diacylglyceryl transferase family protein [Candidatus Peregrinibacteria bacterium]
MHPELIQTKYFTINTLWVLIAVAIIVTVYVITKLATRSGLKIQFLSSYAWKIILVALAGARIFTIIENPKTYFYEFSGKVFLQLFYVWDKGLNIWGAVIAGALFMFYLCKKHEQDFWKWMDTIVPAMILGFAIVHIGAFFEGINYGNETSLPWGVNFESPAIKYTVPIHPTQIYAFLYSLTIAITLILIGRSEKITNISRSGFIAILGTGIYAFFQFLEQFVRGDDTLMIFGIRVPQIIALLIAILSGIFLYLRYNKPAKT